ncbi:MAG: phosphotransferase [Ilumatobacteraceae bacterium]|nr:phosphotransferase [Ilumatobacteraceae bacterium]
MTALDVSAWSGVRVERRVEGGHRNEVWSGSAPTGRVAIRRSRRSAESLAWELELLAALHDDGFLVPVPLLTDDGRSSADGLAVQQWIDGSEPTSRDDWRLVADELERLHARFANHRQRPGCRVVTELDRLSRSVDADMSALPDHAASDVLAVFAAMTHVATSVVHGDPGPSNLRVTDDGRVGLLDWDESRVDVVHLDLASLGVRVLGEDEHHRALRCADAWEAANAWTAEPRYARQRLARLCSTAPAP